MVSTLIFIVVLSTLILIHEFGHFLVAKRCGVRVECFSLGFGPRLWSRAFGGTEYRLSAVPLGGYVKMSGEHPEAAEAPPAPHEFRAQSVGRRAWIVFAGPLLNYLLAFVLLSVVFMIGFPSTPPVVGDVREGYPARAAGLLAGDRIVSVNGTVVEDWDGVMKLIHPHTAGHVTLRLQRAQRQYDVTIQPQVEESLDAIGRKRPVARIGIAPTGEIQLRRYDVLTALWKGAARVWELTALTCQALAAVLIGDASIRETMTGPIGIFVMTGEAAKLGLVYVLHIAGSISLSLAIFNLFPIPVLDGGHLLFLAIERVRGRAVSARAQMAATQVGMAALALLMVAVIYSDLAKFGVADKVVEWWKTR